MNREEYEQYQMLLTALENSPTIQKVKQTAYNLGVLTRMLFPLGFMYWFYKLTDNFSGVFWGYILSGVIYCACVYFKAFFSIEEDKEEDLNKIA